MGDTIGVDSSGEGREGGRGASVLSTTTGSGEADESTEYDVMPDTSVEDGYEKTDVSLNAEGINKTVEELPNNNAVTVDNMQPILRTVSMITRGLLAP